MSMVDDTIPILTDNEMEVLLSIDGGTNRFIPQEVITRLMTLKMVGMHHKGDGVYKLSPTPMGYRFLDDELGTMRHATPCQRFAAFSKTKQ